MIRYWYSVELFGNCSGHARDDASVPLLALEYSDIHAYHRHIVDVCGRDELDYRKANDPCFPVSKNETNPEETHRQ
jgi:hypothetical protein